MLLFVKDRLVVVFFICLVANSVSAQNTSNRILLTESSIVKDSTGRQYPAIEWRKLLSSHEYRIKPVSMMDTNTAFIIYKPSSEQLSIGPYSKAFTTTSRMALNQSTVVKDSSGRQYAPEEWRSLLSSGLYGLKMKNFSDSVFTLYRLSAKQTEHALTRKPTESPNFSIGSNFKGIYGIDIYGNSFGPETIAGKVVVLNFLALGASLKQNIPALNQLVKEYANNTEVVFLSVTISNRQEIRKFIKETPFLYHILEDAKDVIDMYGVASYPTDVVIDKHGKINYSSRGFGPGTAIHLRKAIDESLKGL